MANLTKRSKPEKPYPEFPLYAHASGRWAKKVRGKLHYFGKWNDPQGALKRWQEQADYLRNGLPVPTARHGLTVRDACNHFLSSKKAKLDAGEIVQRTFDRNFNTAKYVVANLGGGLFVETLTPTDFAKLRAKMAKRWGPVALGNEIQIVRSIFRFAYRNDLIEREARFGTEFAKPAKKIVRKARNSKGRRDFTPKEIRDSLGKANVHARAFIFLGINAGVGNTDIAEMTAAAFDLDIGWMTYARTKSGINRRAKLWPETVSAIRDAIESRAEPVDKADSELLFIGPSGKSFRDGGRGTRVGGECRRAFKAAKVERSFYDLRRTFQTVGEESGDAVAVSAIMGHSPRSNDMAAIYRQVVSDKRLGRVADHVREWLGFAG